MGDSMSAIRDAQKGIGPFATKPLEGPRQTKSPTHTKADGQYIGLTRNEPEPNVLGSFDEDGLGFNTWGIGEEPITQQPEKIDMKFDAGKLVWSLLMQGMPNALEEITAVLNYGMQKYEAHSWKGVEDAVNRYTEAMWRHIMAVQQGEEYDEESGLRHAAHIVTNMLFVMELSKGRKTLDFKAPPVR